MSLTQLLIEKLALPLATLLIRSVAGETAGQIGGGLLNIAQRLASDRYEQSGLATGISSHGGIVAGRLQGQQTGDGRCVKRSARFRLISVRFVLFEVLEATGQVYFGGHRRKGPGVVFGQRSTTWRRDETR